MLPVLADLEFAVSCFCVGLFGVGSGGGGLGCWVVVAVFCLSILFLTCFWVALGGCVDIVFCFTVYGWFYC